MKKKKTTFPKPFWFCSTWIIEAPFVHIGTSSEALWCNYAEHTAFCCRPILRGGDVRTFYTDIKMQGGQSGADTNRCIQIRIVSKSVAVKFWELMGTWLMAGKVCDGVKWIRARHFAFGFIDAWTLMTVMWPWHYICLFGRTGTPKKI